MASKRKLFGSVLARPPPIQNTYTVIGLVDRVIAGRHDAETLDDRFEYSDLAHVICRVVGLRALLNESELDDATTTL